MGLGGQSKSQRRSPQSLRHHRWLLETPRYGSGGVWGCRLRLPVGVWGWWWWRRRRRRRRRNSKRQGSLSASSIIKPIHAPAGTRNDQSFLVCFFHGSGLAFSIVLTWNIESVSFAQQNGSQNCWREAPSDPTFRSEMSKRQARQARQA
jgi:hypothetical protein